MKIKDLKALQSEMGIPAELDSTIQARVEAAPASRTGLKVATGIMVGAVLALNALPAVAIELRSYSAAQAIVDFLTLNRFDFVASSPDLRDYGQVGIELTEKYAEEARELYAEYLDTVENPAKIHKAIESSYEIKWQNDEFLVVEHSLFEVMASGYQRISYDVVDLQNQRVLELNDLVDLSEVKSEISEFVYQELANRASAGAGIFIDEISAESVLNRVSDFYVTEQGQLSFVFDEYEIAAGSEGVIEVQVPTALISDSLKVSNLIN